MRKLFALLAVCLATAIAGGASISAANASPLTGGSSAQRQTEQRRREGVLLSSPLSPCCSPPLSPCLLLWCC